MPPQEIPGFYFDEVKRKYFRITNGDQRHNAGYSNNSIQANKRRKRIFSPVDNGGNSRTSKQTELIKYYPTTTDLLINVKLGIACIPSGWPLLTHLQRCNQLSTVVSGKCWILNETKLLFRLDGGDILVYKFHSLLRDPYSPSVNYVPGNGVGSAVEHIDADNSVFFIKYATNDLVVGEFTASGTQLSLIHNQPGQQTCHACISDQGVIVLVGRIFEIFRSSGQREKLAMKWHGNHPVEQMIHQNGVMVIAGQKCVSLLCHSKKFMHVIKHEKQVQRVLLDDMTLRSEKFLGKPLEYVRLTVVTTDTIFVYMIDLLKKKVRTSKEDCVEVNIANDNIALPIVLRIGEQLLVEISGERFTWVDLESRRTQNIVLPCFADARSPNQNRQWGHSRFFVAEDRYFILTSSGVYEFLHT